MKARAWLDRFELPDDESDAARTPLECARGVCVILRQQGRVVAIGQDEMGDALMLRRAMARAMGETLGDPAVASLSEEERRNLGAGLTLQLEIAGTPTPALGADFSQVAKRLTPGVQGVALRRGSMWKLEFPGRMLATNTARSLEQAFPRLAMELGLPAKDLPDLERIDRVGAYSFRTICLAQRGPKESPFEVIRNDEIVHLPEVTAAALQQATERLVEHLHRRMPLWDDSANGALPPPIGIQGDYRPVADQYRPMAGSPMDQAMTAYALARAAESRALDAATREVASATARRILRELAIVSESEGEPLENPATAAAVLLALHAHEALRVPETEELATLARAAVKSTFQIDSGFGILQEDGTSASISPARQAILAAAMAALYADARRVNLSTAQAAVDAAWASTTLEQAADLLPWIITAEQILHADADALSGAERLAEVRRSLHAAQHSPRESAEDPAYVGGFRARPRGPDVAEPTALSLRPGAGLAAMLADERLTTDEERGACRERVMWYARFLLQLSVRESSAWSYRRADRALGGLRESPTDSDQPLAGQAMGLLSLVEMLDALK